jgi:hypothetical protein
MRCERAATLAQVKPADCEDPAGRAGPQEKARRSGLKVARAGGVTGGLTGRELSRRLHSPMNFQTPVSFPAGSSGDEPRTHASAIGRGMWLIAKLGSAAITSTAIRRNRGRRRDGKEKPNGEQFGYRASISSLVCGLPSQSGTKNPVLRSGHQQMGFTSGLVCTRENAQAGPIREYSTTDALGAKKAGVSLSETARRDGNRAGPHRRRPDHRPKRLFGGLRGTKQL